MCRRFSTFEVPYPPHPFCTKKSKKAIRMDKPGGGAECGDSDLGGQYDKHVFVHPPDKSTSDEKDRAKNEMKRADLSEV